MPKTLGPLMYKDEFFATVADAAPTQSMLINFEYGDIEKAIEFWLNNVVFRHPVEVQSIRMTRSGATDVIIQPVKQKLPPR